MAQLGRVTCELFVIVQMGLECFVEIGKECLLLTFQLNYAHAVGKNSRLSSVISADFLHIRKYG